MKTAKVITGVIIVLIAALAVGLIFKFTNGFNEEFKTFYLEQNGCWICSFFRSCHAFSTIFRPFSPKRTGGVS